MKAKEMKRKYERPTMDIVKLQHQKQLLTTGSTTGNREDYGGNHDELEW